MNENIFNLFVYGSLRSGFRNPAYEYITRYFHCAGEAVVKGKFYDKGTYPVAVPADGESFIQGELYTMNSKAEFSWAFEQLDDYEGVNTEAGEKPLYRRALTDVFQNGDNKKAWIYWYNNDVSELPEVETGDVMKYLHQKNQP